MLTASDSVMTRLTLSPRTWSPDARLLSLQPQYTREAVLVSSPERAILLVYCRPDGQWHPPGDREKRAAVQQADEQDAETWRGTLFRCILSAAAAQSAVRALPVLTGDRTPEKRVGVKGDIVREVKDKIGRPGPAQSLVLGPVL